MNNYTCTCTCSCHSTLCFYSMYTTTYMYIHVTLCASYIVYTCSSAKGLLSAFSLKKWIKNPSPSSVFQWVFFWVGSKWKSVRYIDGETSIPVSCGCGDGWGQRVAGREEESTAHRERGGETMAQREQDSISAGGGQPSPGQIPSHGLCHVISLATTQQVVYS